MRQLLEGTSKATTYTHDNTESASELDEGDLEDGAHSEKAFIRRFPNFKTGITPPLTINSNWIPKSRRDATSSALKLANRLFTSRRYLIVYRSGKELIRNF